MDARFAVVVAGAPVHGADHVAGIVAPYLEVLQGMGGRRALAPPGADGPPCLFLAATGGSERALLDSWAGRGPLFLVAHPGHNSLPAALEVMAAVVSSGGRGRILYFRSPDDAAAHAAVQTAVAGLETAAALRRARLGVVGAPSDWLVASLADPGEVRRVWGPEVVALGMDRLLPACRAAAVEGAAGGGVEAALRALVRTERLDAVTVRCFDLIGALQATACPALSALNDEGVVGGCEGDVPAALAMLWVRLLLGAASWMANPARLDAPAGTLTLAHCTVPRSLVGAVRTTTHFESGLGQALAGEFAPGPVTLLRLGGGRLERLWLQEGELVGAGQEADLCRTQAVVRLAPGVIDGLLRAPLGNHLVLVPGHHAARLRDWWEVFVGEGG